MKALKLTAILFTILSLALSWGMATWALTLEEYSAPDLLLFLGRFHPLILHLPIGFTVLALLLELGQLLPARLRKTLPATTLLHGLIVLTTTSTVIHGILLYAGGGYEDSDLARRHLIGGCLFLTAAAVTFTLKLSYSRSTLRTFLCIAATLISFATLSISAHDGASLTHGEHYLTQYAPELLKPLLTPGYQTPETPPPPAPVPLGQLELYPHIIQPIFDRTCVECHKASKKKGKLRMDSYQELMKGGAGGEVVVAGNLDDSYILELIHAPLDDDEHMPPEGKAQLTSGEIAILEWWITIGIPSAGTLNTHNPPAPIQTHIKTFLKN